MAGSYQHVKHGYSMLENRGDACEAIDELLWLVESQIGEEKAKQLLDNQYYPMCRKEIEPDKAFVNTRALRSE